MSRLLHPFTPPAKDTEPFVNIASGQGAVLTLKDGREVIDAMGSLWYCNVGYGHPKVTQAIKDQLDTIHAHHIFDPFTNDVAEAAADAIVERAPTDGGKVFFAQSGSEAVDTALKLARSAQAQAGHPEKTIVISRTNGYHGTAYGGTSAQGFPEYRAGWGGLVPDHIHVQGDDIEAMASVFAEKGHEIAAVIAEPVQGAGGVVPPPPGYLEGIRRLCTEHGALYISDEVICGFGRLGTWFGAQYYDVEPDMITFAKAVTSGYVPLGGVVCSDRVVGMLETNPDWKLAHGFTYSGHQTACAAALACMEVTEEEGLLERATVLGERLRSGLQSLVDDGLFAGLRGAGFVWALTTHEHQTPVDVRNEILANGAIVRPMAASLGFCPPMVMTEDQVDRVVDAVASAV
ncbi:MAG: aminotransferase class III-fold pyridoxal phosphate-dependent enzyme [Actinomycetota bacterium]